MKAKPVIPRQQAHRDVNLAIDFYLSENSPEAALGFVDAQAQAYRHIGRSPATGSSRYASELNIPGLRYWPLKKYPHLAFYLDRSDHIDVWRVLHEQRDISASMREPDLI